MCGTRLCVVFMLSGGHADFSPRTDLEYEIMKAIEERANVSRCSVERLVSGEGLKSIFGYLSHKYPERVNPEVLERMKHEDMGAVIDGFALNKSVMNICT